MPILLLFAGLLGLLMAERHRHRNAMRNWERNPIEPKPDPMRPSRTEAGPFMFVLGLMGCGMGVLQLFSSDYSPATGRHSWFWNAIYAHFGTSGIAAAWFSVGAIFIAIGVDALRSK